MIFKTPLVRGFFIKRYKRFFADIRLEDGRVVVAHVPNTGSMLSCLEDNIPCALSFDPNPKRKLSYTLEMTFNGVTWIGLNTLKTNYLVEEALQNAVISECQGYSKILREQTIGDSRLDFLLSQHPSRKDLYLEVKNVTLKENNVALFPDAVSTRGHKHLKELMNIKKSSCDSALLFVIQREDTALFSPAQKIDPFYTELFYSAQAMGVLILAYSCQVSPQEIKIYQSIPIN
ncbi:MAG: DNA/RNA nuclease SfsA [Bacteriovoracaceae bacterium]|nr:DNA/RNA nuclease SfsA [Bacteriovoracaceae bacterium]